jgi:hypothetical protein
MKFHSVLAEALYESVLEGYSDDIQTEDNGREFAIFTDFDAGEDGIIHAILIEYEDGNIIADTYPTKASAEQAWDEISREIEELTPEPLDMGENDE